VSWIPQVHGVVYGDGMAVPQPGVECKEGGGGGGGGERRETSRWDGGSRREAHEDGPGQGQGDQTRPDQRGGCGQDETTNSASPPVEKGFLAESDVAKTERESLNGWLTGGREGTMAARGPRQRGEQANRHREILILLPLSPLSPARGGQYSKVDGWMRDR
jgi:hypothetical protein